ncbi:uncharacterized protein LOC101455895 [Ceratitis capitata]|nr:uncharacterized protein LOC101455895 [Ceratitis capitata]XP_020717930.1 uncharacterized protein LOC101455895 [Ceratitis capitata]
MRFYWYQRRANQLVRLRMREVRRDDVDEEHGMNVIAGPAVLALYTLEDDDSFSRGSYSSLRSPRSEERGYEDGDEDSPVRLSTPPRLRLYEVRQLQPWEGSPDFCDSYL